LRSGKKIGDEQLFEGSFPPDLRSIGQVHYSVQAVFTQASGITRIASADTPGGVRTLTVASATSGGSTSAGAQASVAGASRTTGSGGGAGRPAPQDRKDRSPAIPDAIDERTLGVLLGTRLAGTTAADGSGATSSAPQKVIWVEQGDEVLVHLDSIAVRIMDGIVLVSVDLETDQTGRTPLVVSFSVGSGNDPAGLVAVTEDFPRGNGLLASRWGRALQAAAWASLLGIATDHATERSSAPLGIAAVAGTLSLKAGAPLTVVRAAK
jgi:hypothetical protein